MQQVAARNCLHGAASGARDGVSVPDEVFWNAAARSVRFAASLAAAACICMQIARVPPHERDRLERVACDTWSDAAMQNGYMLDRIHGGSLKHFAAVFVRARGCAKPSGVGWRSVPSWEVCRGPRHQWSLCAPHTWGVTSALAGDANATVNIPHIAAAATASRPK